METLQPITILLVEDDVGDQKLIKKSLAQQKIGNEVLTAKSAEQALDYLVRSNENNKEHPRPDLILLDLNMPGMGGKEFLRLIKGDDLLDTIPVVILTTSDLDRDILESYKLHASGYIKKPVNLQGFQEVMSKLEAYWFTICKRVQDIRT